MKKIRVLRSLSALFTVAAVCLGFMFTAPMAKAMPPAYKYSVKAYNNSGVTVDAYFNNATLNLNEFQDYVDGDILFISSTSGCVTASPPIDVATTPFKTVHFTQPSETVAFLYNNFLIIVKCLQTM